MELNIKYPNYLSIKDWKYFKSLDDDTTASKMINFISYLSNTSQKEIETLTPQEVQSTYLKILQTFGDVDSKFFPVIEINGVLYGFSSIAKMTLGEYVDLERLAKEPNNNLEEIMAILYRPITNHSFNGIKWNFIKTFKVGFGKVENLFKYYTIEKYDSSKNVEQADLMATRIEFEREWNPKLKGEVKKVNNFAVTKAPKQTIKTKTLSNVKSQGLMDMLDNI